MPQTACAIAAPLQLPVRIEPGLAEFLNSRWFEAQPVDEPMQRQLVAAVEAYPPGQGGIDGGGFKIVEADAARGYLYAQFESLKNGYVDDLELALVGPSGPLLVRSASRLGFLDFGVNARRLNWIAARLRADGWKAPPIDAATWPDYFAQNRDRP